MYLNLFITAPATTRRTTAKLSCTNKFSISILATRDRTKKKRIWNDKKFTNYSYLSQCSTGKQSFMVRKIKINTDTNFLDILTLIATFADALASHRTHHNNGRYLFGCEIKRIRKTTHFMRILLWCRRRCWCFCVWPSSVHVLRNGKIKAPSPAAQTKICVDGRWNIYARAHTSAIYHRYVYSIGMCNV